MDEQILHLYETHKNEELGELLTKMKDSEIKEMLDNYVLRGRKDPVGLIQAVLSGLSVLECEGTEKQLLVYRHLIKVLQKNEINSKTASNLVGLLMLETENLDSSNLIELANVFTESVKTGSFKGGKAIDLFPKILSELSTQEKVIYSEGSMKGSECKSHILNSLCSGRWDPQTVINLAAMFKDVPLTSEELKFVIEKILRAFPELDIQDLPTLVYQLLLLATKGPRRLVIDGIASFFIDQDTLNRRHIIEEASEDLMSEDYSIDALRHAEGTVILHIVFSIKQDQELGREFVKYLKSTLQQQPAKVLAPFNLALSLSVARIHRFEDQIYDFIKSTILKTLKDCEKQNSSLWVREMVPEKIDVVGLVLETVNNSKYGWDHVLQGLVQLGFTLMDSFGPKAAFGKEIHQTSTKTPSQLAGKLGADILKKTFKVHEVVRAEILDQIFNRILTKATTPISHYLDLLGNIVSAAPQFLLESIPKVKETFDYLSFLPPRAAEGLLKAIQPLLKLSMSLKDSLIIVLKKSMFSRQLEARKIGLVGFLMILKHFKVLGGLPSSQCSQPFTLSQVQVDVHARHNPASNEALCLEILGNLRRCCTQQADIRLQLYEGLHEVVHRNTQLQMSVLDMLLNQIKKYYEEDKDVSPPLRLDRCIIAQGENIFLAEPLAHLLSCAQHIVRKTKDTQTRQLKSMDDDDDDEEEENSLTDFQLLLSTLTLRMINSELEDFEIDKSADFSLTNSVGTKNNIFAILIMGVYETLMEYIFLSNKYSIDSCEKVLKLYENYVKVSDIMKEKPNNAKKGKAVPSKSSKPPTSLFSLDFIVDMITALFTDMTPSHKSALDILRNNGDFTRHIVSIALHKIQQFSEKGLCDGAAGLDNNKIIEHCCRLAKLFLIFYIENQMLNDKKTKMLTSVCLDGLVSIFTICTTDEDKLCQCLKALEDEGSKNSWTIKIRTEKIHFHVKKLQRLVANVLSSDKDHQNIKEVGSLLTIIGQLTGHLQATSTQYEEVQSWMYRLCTDQTIDDISTCKQLLSTLLTITQQSKDLPNVLKLMCQDIHSQLGDTDQELEVDDKTNFSLITIRTAAPTVLQLLLHQIDREINDLDWVIGRLKSDINAISGDELPNATQQETQEKNVCNRYGVLITGFFELVQSAMPSGVCIDTMVKSVTHLYTSLSVLVKYYITLYTSKTGHLTSRFEKLVKIIGNKLTPYVYSFITYIQSLEKEQIAQASDHLKTKKDKKKAGNSNIPAGKVIKQTRIIPNLIYSIEQFERFLIHLSKKSKVNLMDNVKMSTSRDFRINTAAVQAVLEQESSSSETEEENIEQDDENSDAENQSSISNTSQQDQPPLKKSKLGSKTKVRA